MLDDIPKYFQLPITYLTEKSELKNTISSDLELVESTETPIYEFAFRPQTTLGKSVIKQAKDYYTSDIIYLRETQEFLKSYNPAPSVNKDDIVNMVELFNEVKLDTGFKERYFYIDWDYWESLNHSESFLQYMSMYNMASPVLSLLTPICIMIVPFFILKAKGVDVSMQEYISVLKMVASNNAIGRICTQFQSVPTDQKIYLIVSAVFYLFSIYQSILSCIRFYNNMKKIHASLLLIRRYIAGTISTMNEFLSCSEKLASYEPFNKIARENILILKEFKETLDEVSGVSFSLKNVRQVGKLLRMFYDFYSKESIHACLMYSFGFHGYVDMVTGLLCNIKERKMAFADFSDGEKETKSCKKNKNIFKNSYYGALVDKNPVKNTVDLDKNLIITGPNASGKTTVLKSALINLILTQQFGCGMYESAKLTPFKYIHCYLNIPDTSGRDSLFQAEARRCKEILDIIGKNTTDRHFCVFDELYSGTNPEEATVSALAFMEYLVKHKNVKCILTTHFIKVCKKLKKNKKVENFHMETKQENGDFSYTYLLKKGISEVRGGFKVLCDMNYPEEICKELYKNG